MTPKRRKKKVNKGKLARFIMIVLLIIALVIGVFLFSPLFNVKKITVLGNKAVTAEEITSKSGINPGINIFRVNAKKVKNNLSSLTMLDEIKLKRKLPGEVEIVVTETYPKIIMPYMTGYVTANEHGKVIEITDEIKEDMTLPLLSGIEITEAKAGEIIKVKDEVTFSMVMECVEILIEKDAIKQFKSLDFSNLSNFTAYTHEGVKVIFGKIEDIEYKISFLEGILPNVEQTEGAYIDISSSTSGIYGNSANEETQEPPLEDSASPEDEGEEGTQEPEETQPEEEDEPAEAESSAAAEEAA